MYRKVSEDEVPRRSRPTQSAFETTREWARMKTDLEKGLNRGEALEIVLTPDDMKRIGLMRRSIAMFIIKYLERNGLEKYKVRNFLSDGLVYFVVKYPAAKQTRRVA